MKMEEYEFLMASPCRFVGSSESEVISIDHVFKNIFNYEKSYKHKDESFHLIKFKATEHEKGAGRLVPNYYPVGEYVSQMLTVFFGKLVLPLGFFKSNNTYCFPDHVDLTQFDTSLPFYSNTERFELPTKLNRGVIKDLSLNKLDKTFLDASKVYQNALIDYPKDTSIAYMSLVGAGEILTNEITFEDLDLYDKTDLLLIAEVKEKLGESKANQVKSRMRKIKRRYYKGIESYFDERIINNDQTIYGKLSKENLESALKASYDLRSKFLHEGFRMGMHTKDNFLEVGLTHSLGYSESVKNLLAKAPTFTTLERVIRFSLLKKLFALHDQEIFVPSEETPFPFS